ncbi:enoyl-CoA hydratase-related protein [Nonomuraea muscovyensis]|jgi:methylglutaconyl-CoA hydratase|uniref:Methylglutaconyl-CoA hydratase n=1 Tax=Nonomuraea muscovyensis TaxID=1124761 RepID=A0A7X0EY80_9ACTN|nr:enoyl-CoA hydratase-related protein [Nonomuraea muscovyensis]MBB6348872.1 methylglutaconyl-CoA hydratase [Nonomuraea muscovyensis]MDF2708622.1 enoyl-CoA hydratase [Nonomuraea muscovyensis]
MTRLVHKELANGVATITLDSPPNRNALSVRLLADLEDRLGWALAEPEARVIVLTGTGPVFCSGADLKEQRVERASGAADAPVTASFPEILALLWESPKPVICRLNGTARAGGLGLVAACDFAIAPETASFAFTEVRLGVVPAMIAVPVLRRLHSRAAAEYFLTGEVFDASRAVEIGLLTRAVPEEELDATVARYAGMLVRGGPESLAITKRLVRDLPGVSFEEGLRRMAALSAQRFTSEEGQEGIAAFMAKRPPAWVPPGERTP